MKTTGWMKRALCLVLVVMTLVLTSAPALAKSKASGAYVVTTVEKHDRLRVRSAPNGAVKDYIKKGTVVVYKSSKSGWWYVQYRSSNGSLKKGYIDKSFLTSVSNLSNSKFAPVDNLYVRKEHKTNSVKVKIKKGLKVKIVGQYKTWACISYKGKAGWVPSVYLRRV